MDQFASAFGEAGHALLLDCRTLEHGSIALADDDVALVACHSGSPRKLESSAYNERRSQCEAAVAVIAETEPGVTALRDVTPAMLDAARPRMDPIVAALVGLNILVTGFRLVSQSMTSLLDAAMPAEEPSTPEPT